VNDLLDLSGSARMARRVDVQGWAADHTRGPGPHGSHSMALLSCCTAALMALMQRATQARWRGTANQSERMLRFILRQELPGD
jgi:hypothetical protein